MAARIPNWVAKMNEHHAVIFLGGKARVMTERYDKVFGRWVLSFSTYNDIREFYSDHQIALDASEPDRTQGIGLLWLIHPLHRKYLGITFAPDGKVPDDHYNLWRGFGVEPKAGDWSLLNEHLFDNICQQDGDLYSYVMGWKATAVQYPAEPAGVALVLRGRQGTGKGVFAREFGSLFGQQHFLQISNVKHLTGTFNSHLRDTLLLFADEVFCSGRKSDEAEMKRLITEPTLAIEAKYRDLAVARNMLHVIIASNESWVVPAGPHERRFCVLDVGEAHIQDGPYFSAISKQMRDGGRQAMLYDLLNYDLSKFDIRKAPATRALQDQKEMSMKPAERWWYEKLWDGQLMPADNGWTREVRRDYLCSNFMTSMDEAGVRAGGMSAVTSLGMLLDRMLHGAVHDSRRLVGGARVRFWHFPPLAEARAMFDKAMGQIKPWPKETR
jgi:hypothetical protein